MQKAAGHIAGHVAAAQQLWERACPAMRPAQTPSARQPTPQPRQKLPRQRIILAIAMHQAGPGRRKGATDADGRPLEIHTVSPPLAPRRSKHSRGNPDFAAGYINYFVINGAVIAPQFGDKRADGKARDLLVKLYSGREVVQLDIEAIAAGGGGIHCVTHQCPAV